MCLQCKDNKFKIADKDIVCYKYVEYSNDTYHTPYKYVSIDNEIIEGKKPFCAKGKTEIHKEDSVFTFEGGVIHTFNTLGAAEEVCKSFGDVEYNAIFKCIIPKGTKYVEGRFGTEFALVDSYASKEIIFNELVYKNF